MHFFLLQMAEDEATSRSPTPDADAGPSVADAGGDQFVIPTDDTVMESAAASGAAAATSTDLSNSPGPSGSGQAPMDAATSPGGSSGLTDWSKETLLAVGQMLSRILLDAGAVWRSSTAVDPGGGFFAAECSADLLIVKEALNMIKQVRGALPRRF